MCMDGNILDSRIWKKIIKQTCFSYFWCGFKVKTSVYAWTCDEHPRTSEEHIGTFKNIQTYSREFK